MIVIKYNLNSLQKFSYTCIRQLSIEYMHYKEDQNKTYESKASHGVRAT